MLINKNFTFLFFSTLISGIGTGLTALGIAWVIQQQYADFNALALLGTIGLIFAFIVLPKFSLYVDTYSKIGVAKILFFTGFLFQLIFLIIHWLIGLKLWLLISIGIISSLLNALEPVNRVAIAKTITTKEQYASTIRLLELMQQLMTFIAGLIGILLIKRISYVLIADALSFLFAFALVHCIKIEKNQSSHVAVIDTGSKSIDVSTSKINSTLYVFGTITLIPYICIMAQRVIYPGHFEILLHTTAAQYSLYTLPYAFGAIFAIGIIGIMNKHIDKYLSIFFGILLYAIAVSCILIFPTLYVTYSAFFIFSLCHCTIRINRLELIMHLVPMEYFGRVNGRFQSFTSMMIILLSWLPALLMNNLGIAAGWIIYSAVSAISVIVYLFYLRSIRCLCFPLSVKVSALIR